MILSGLSLIMIIASIPALIIAAAGHEYAHVMDRDYARGNACPYRAFNCSMETCVYRCVKVKNPLPEDS